MSSFLRSAWLRFVLESKLGLTVDELESYVPGTHVQKGHLSISPDRIDVLVEKKQHVQMIGNVRQYAPFEAMAHQNRLRLIMIFLMLSSLTAQIASEQHSRMIVRALSISNMEGVYMLSRGLF